MILIDYWCRVHTGLNIEGPINQLYMDALNKEVEDDALKDISDLEFSFVIFNLTYERNDFQKILDKYIEIDFYI